MAIKETVIAFSLAKARVNPAKICDVNGAAPYSVTILSGATYDAKVAVVWTKGSQVALYDSTGSRVFGNTPRRQIYFKAKAVKYCGVYSTKTVYGKDKNLPVVDVDYSEIERIESSPSFQRWVTGPSPA